MTYLIARNKNITGVNVPRPNKLARGMTETWNRTQNQRHKQPSELSDTALRLSVRGTFDNLHGLGYYVERIACPCCRSKNAGPLRLNKAGRTRLRLAQIRLASNHKGTSE